MKKIDAIKQRSAAGYGSYPEAAVDDVELLLRVVPALVGCVQSIREIEAFMSQEGKPPIGRGENFAEWSHPGVSLRMAHEALTALDEKEQNG